MSNPVLAGLTGLNAVAHAIRRSTALTVALSLTPQEGTEEDLLETAERLDRWLLVNPQQQETPWSTM